MRGQVRDIERSQRVLPRLSAEDRKALSRAASRAQRIWEDASQGRQTAAKGVGGFFPPMKPRSRSLGIHATNSWG